MPQWLTKFWNKIYNKVHQQKETSYLPTCILFSHRVFSFSVFTCHAADKACEPYSKFSLAPGLNLNFVFVSPRWRKFQVNMSTSWSQVFRLRQSPLITFTFVSLNYTVHSNTTWQFHLNCGEKVNQSPNRPSWANAVSIMPILFSETIFHAKLKPLSNGVWQKYDMVVLLRNKLI